MTDVKKEKSRFIRRILPTFAAAFPLPFIVCFCIPLEIYANNLDEFLFSANGFLPFSVLFTFLVTAVIFFATIFLPNKGYRVTCAVFLSLAFMCLLQGTYLNGNLSSLAGDNLGVAEISTFTKIFNVFIWVAVIAGGVILALLKKKADIVNTVAIVLVIVIIAAQGVSPLVAVMNNGDVFVPKENRVIEGAESANHQILTTKNLTTISSDRNVFYFCVDRFDQEYAEQAIEECPEVFDTLQGFTSFRDNIAIYGHTFPGISNLLTSERYDISGTRGEYLNSVYQENKTIEVLHEAGYKINLFTQPYYAYTDAYYLPDYVENKSEATTYEVYDKARLSLNLMQIALYRCFPFVGKALVGTASSATCNNFVLSEGGNGYAEYSVDMRRAYTAMTAEEFSTINDKVFTFIHIDGCHGVEYDEEWNNASLSERGDIMISLKNSFAIINLYLDALKESGVYDEATIVITGDHGTPQNDLTNMSDATLTALFVKPSGVSNTALRYSDAQVSHDNVWSAILQSEGIEPDESLAKSVFDVPEGEDQVREHFWHTYGPSLDEYVYNITGAGKDFDNWEQIAHTHMNKFIMD